MSNGRGSVRIGPVSLLTLVIVLCIATMAVLAVTTAQATYSATERQASFVEDTYKNESAAQAFVSRIDGVLAEARSGTMGGQAALAKIDRSLSQIVSEVSEDGVTVQAAIEGSTVRASFTRESGRSLEIELAIENGRTYSIMQWKTTTQWNEEGGSETLWPGAVQSG